MKNGQFSNDVHAPGMQQKYWSQRKFAKKNLINLCTAYVVIQKNKFKD